jgi:DNA-binding transcriptional MocR family regulator
LNHRQAGAAWLSRFGLQATQDDILVTSGSQNALACCLMALFRSCHRIAVDELTCPGIKTLASMLGIRLVPIDMDAEGMSPDALAAACRGMISEVSSSCPKFKTRPPLYRPTTGGSGSLPSSNNMT